MLTWRSRVVDHARVLATLACVAAGNGTLFVVRAQTPPPQDPLPSFRTSIEAVQVAAIVTDERGEPVTGLTEADFEIFENGTMQPITTFSAVNIPVERSDPALGEPDVVGNDRPPGRLYVFALDTMGAGNALRTRHFLRQFLERHFGPNDTAAVVLTTRGLRDSGQDFTSNSRLLLNAIDKFGGGGDFGDAREQEKNLMGSLRDLTESIAKLPGRKALIFMSEGIGNPDRPDGGCGCDPNDLIDPPGPLGGIFTNVDIDFQRAMSAATRGNVAIYPIDPRGLTTELTPAGSFDTTELTNRMILQALADFTGGFALTNSNNYEAALGRLVREHSTYYLLGFNSAEQRRDGRYVRIDVRVKRPGLQVRSLDGYLAPRDRPPASRPTTLLRAVSDAVVSPVAMSGVPMRVFAAPFRGAGKDATVAVALEIAASKLNLVESNGVHTGELEIVIAVTDVTKKKWPMMRHRASLALKPETYERVTGSGLRVLSQLRLPEGRYQLRVSAGGASLAGSVVYDLAVPDFGDDFSLSGVAVTSRQGNEAVTVTPDGRIDVAWPGLPTTAREFDRGDTLTLFAEAYENRRRPHTIHFTTELRDETGGVVATTSSQRQVTAKPEQTSVHQLTQTLALDAVPPGRYVIRLNARSSLDRAASLSRDVPISVR